jgi:hypothetical protein
MFKPKQAKMSFDDHSYIEFLSWGFKEPPESPYQIVIPDIKGLYTETDNEKLKDNPHYLDPLCREVKNQYIQKITELCFPPSEIVKFLDYHYSKYFESEKLDFVHFIDFSVAELLKMHGNLQDLLLRNTYILETLGKWIKKKKKELGAETGEQTIPQLIKIKWNGSPSLFGYLFTELAIHGFISFPTHAGDISYSGLAKQLSNHFDIKTTPENLIKEFNPEKNTLSSTKRAKFTIPELSDLA